jgi:hypothetical protein
VKVYIVSRLPRSDQGIADLANLVVNETNKASHQPFVAFQEIINQGFLDARIFMPFVRQQIRRSDLVIVLYDSNLRGGLVEEGIAYADGIPIWLLHQAGDRVSSSALGCADLVIAYGSKDELVERLGIAFKLNA